MLIHRTDKKKCGGILSLDLMKSGTVPIKLCADISIVGTGRVGISKLYFDMAENSESPLSITSLFCTHCGDNMESREEIGSRCSYCGNTLNIDDLSFIDKGNGIYCDKCCGLIEKDHGNTVIKTPIELSTIKLK